MPAPTLSWREGDTALCVSRKTLDAPYLGVTWNRKHGKTADFAEAAGERTDGARFVTGLRLWF